MRHISNTFLAETRRLLLLLLIDDAREYKTFFDKSMFIKRYRFRPYSAIFKRTTVQNFNNLHILIKHTNYLQSIFKCHEYLFNLAIRKSLNVV